MNDPLVFIVVKVLGFLFVAFVLQLVIRNEKVGQLSYLKSIITLLPGALLSFVVFFLPQLNSLLWTVLHIIVQYFIFYFMIRQYFPLDWKKVLKVYIILGLITFALGLILAIPLVYLLGVKPQL